MVFATTYLTADPVWPWSLPGIGWPLWGGVALLLVLLTLWTYLGSRGTSWRRLVTVIVLRLIALTVALLVVLQPSLAFQQDEAIPPSKVLVVIDYSSSMNITDAFNGLSRWDDARRILSAPAVVRALKNLVQDYRVEVIYYQGAEDLKPFDPDGKADGKRTEMKVWLQKLWEKHGGDPSLRGLILLTDGADTGVKLHTLEQAKLRPSGCPIHPFGLGRPTTTAKQQDIQLVQILPEPAAVPVKTKLAVKGIINAPGFENARVKVSLWMEGYPVPVKVEDKVLTRTQGNEVVLVCDAPDKPGEVKVTLKIEPLPGEITPLNNEISTYVSVTKDGVSVLWVEGRKRLESVFAKRHALDRDPRFRVYFVELLPGTSPTPEIVKLFDFDTKHYDAIVIGDITAQRLGQVRANLFSRINEQVTAKGTGLLMMGGYETFGNSDWHALAQPLRELWPVNISKPTGQVEGEVRMTPTKPGLEHYLLRLADNPADNLKLWKKDLEPLDGMTNLGTPDQRSTVLATADGDKPLLVGAQRGQGRILAFGGDTTYKAWRRSPETLTAYERFWKQMMLWLAHQENVEGNAWVKLDTRRVDAGAGERLGMTMGLRGKGGVDVKNARYTVKVIGPQGEKIDVPTLVESQQTRGYFLKADRPGEYKVEVKAEGKDADGKDVEGTASARFLAYADDIENLRPAADHDFLTKLAQAGGGRFRLADERAFLQLLDDLQSTTRTQQVRFVEYWPPWKLDPGSSELIDQLPALWRSAALACFLLFVALVCSEWALRRMWGMV